MMRWPGELCYGFDVLLTLFLLGDLFPIFLTPNLWFQTRDPEFCHPQNQLLYLNSQTMNENIPVQPNTIVPSTRKLNVNIEHLITFCCTSAQFS